MKLKLKMPRLAVSMTEGSFAEWLVPDQSDVVAGQPIYVVEGDKAANEVPAPAAGRLTHVARPGSTYKVGDIIAELDGPDIGR